MKKFQKKTKCSVSRFLVTKKIVIICDFLYCCKIKRRAKLIKIITQKYWGTLTSELCLGLFMRPSRSYSIWIDFFGKVFSWHSEIIIIKIINKNFGDIFQHINKTYKSKTLCNFWFRLQTVFLNTVKSLILKSSHFFKNWKVNFNDL